MTDAWLDSSSEKNNCDFGELETGQRSESALKFEDNFVASSQLISTEKKDKNSNQHDPLPDSDSYLQGLERKLEKIKKDSKLVKSLAEKREDCWRTLLQEDSTVPRADANHSELIELDTAVTNGDSAVQEIYRHIQPVQPLTVGETIHIVEFDQLDQQRQADENSEVVPKRPTQ